MRIGGEHAIIGTRTDLGKWLPETVTEIGLWEAQFDQFPQHPSLIESDDALSVAYQMRQ